MLDASQFVIRSLLDDGVITPEMVGRAEESASKNACDVATALVDLGIVASRTLAIARSKVCEYPFVDLEKYEIDIQNSRLIPRRVAEELGAFPIFLIGEVATVAMDDPLDLRAIDMLTQMLRAQIDPVICEPQQLGGLISRAYSLAGSADDASSPGAEVSLTTGDEPVVAAVNQILFAAIDAGASDIHVNPDERTLHLRYRVDGTLTSKQGPDVSMHPAIVQRLKVMANLDLTQTRRPQDGKFRVVHEGEQVDVRLSLLPTVHGENAVLRLLRPASAIGSVDDLGMSAAVAEQFKEIIAHPHGLLLVTGPTGSGKTTTLYTALNRISTPALNVITVEDPVEIRMPLVRQVPVNAEIGMSFAGALRSILRQDPDVILVGEIRDEETAKIATQAALTGHLVLSTLHTNDAVGAIARLRDFDVPAFAINGSLRGAIGQRLIRRVCADCAAPVAPDDARLASLGLSGADAAGMVEGTGCPKCMSTGHQGRLGVYELMRSSHALEALIDAGASTTELRREAIAGGLRTLFQDGVDKARIGLTSIAELAALRANVDSGLKTDDTAAPGMAA